MTDTHEHCHCVAPLVAALNDVVGHCISVATQDARAESDRETVLLKAREALSIVKATQPPKQPAPTPKGPPNE